METKGVRLGTRSRGSNLPRKKEKKQRKKVTLVRSNPVTEEDLFRSGFRPRDRPICFTFTCVGQLRISTGTTPSTTTRPTVINIMEEHTIGENAHSRARAQESRALDSRQLGRCARFARESALSNTSREERFIGNLKHALIFYAYVYFSRDAYALAERSGNQNHSRSDVPRSLR